MSNVVDAYFNNRTPEVEALYAAYRRGEVDIFGNPKGTSLAESVANPNLTNTSVIGQAPTQTDTPSDIMTRADVERLYQDVLDRKADPFGLDFYTDKSYAQAKREIEAGPEYLTNEYYKEKFGTPLTYEQRALFPADMSLADRYAKIDSFAVPGGDTGTGTDTGGTDTGGISTLSPFSNPTGAVPIDLGLERTFRGVVDRDPRQEDYDFYLKEYGDTFDFADRANLTRRLRPEQLQRFQTQLGLPAATDFSSFGATPATAGIERLRPTDTTGTMAGVFASPQFTSPFSIQTEQQELPKDTFTQLGDLFGEQFKADLRAEAAEEAESKRAGGLASLYKEGGEVGDAGLANIAQKMASYGRYGDTMLAHISPEEAMMLKAMGGSGTRNPVTGLPEFFLKKLYRSVKSIVKPIYRIAKAALPTIIAVNNPVLGATLAAADAGFKDGKFDLKDAGIAAIKTIAQAKAAQAISGGPPSSAGAPGVPGSPGVSQTTISGNTTLGTGGGSTAGFVGGQSTASAVTPSIGESLSQPFTDPKGFGTDIAETTRSLGQGVENIFKGDFSGLKDATTPLAITGLTYSAEAGLKEAEKAKREQQAIFAAEEDKKKRFRELASRLGQQFPFGYNEGGISSLPPRYLDGMGDGMSDSIKANIGGMQEARLADGEFVVPADVVADLGNGSSNAGAERLYSMMDRIRQARHGTTKQPPEVNVNKALPA